jgi:GTPase SAR1 family protein
MTFAQHGPRIAILGPGGVGKTSLAKTILHDLKISARYGDHRVFVACDSVSTKVELAALISAHLGLKSGKNLTKPIIQDFAEGPPCLLVLAHLETPWEPAGSHREIEVFLSLLSDVNHLALIVSSLHHLSLPD